MTDAILIFTFSPIQPFIAEARRTMDLYAGSQILVELSKAACSVFVDLEHAGKGELIYPPILQGDVPNRLVTQVPWEDAEKIAEQAQEAFFEKWQSLAQEAKDYLTKFSPKIDKVWETIWDRQIAREYFWEIYWAATELTEKGYKEAYLEADGVIASIKRMRAFSQPVGGEPGKKDSLSGKRQALRTQNLNATEFWKKVSEADEITLSKLQPNGRERLDGLGIIKRFCQKATKSVAPFFGVPSTSSIASADFYQIVKKKEYQAELQTFEKALEPIGIFSVRSEPFVYDGAFFYTETLTAGRLERDYNIKNVDPKVLENATKKLKALYKEAGDKKPSPYYAVIIFDGDDIGIKVSSCLEEENPKEAHKQFSKKLLQFSDNVINIARTHYAFIIYNGGDDVMAIAPLSKTFPFCSDLAKQFREDTQGTASAGIAIVHHLYPLSAALRIAKDAEHVAKNMDEKKNAVCVKIIKRSGDPVQIIAKWADADKAFNQAVDLFTDDEEHGAALSSAFAYNVLDSASTLIEADEIFESELKRLLKRNSNSQSSKFDKITEFENGLYQFAKALPGKSEELGNWLAFALFVAQGGLT